MVSKEPHPATRSRCKLGSHPVVTVWGIVKATEMARAELYTGYALEVARAGRLKEARNVALECVGHVTLEDPRSHVLLAKIGIALRHRTLVREARAFLQYLRVTEWDDRLDELEKSGSQDFGESG